MYGFRQTRHLELLEGFYGREPEWSLLIRNGVDLKFRKFSVAGVKNHSYFDTFRSRSHKICQDFRWRCFSLVAAS